MNTGSRAEQSLLGAILLQPNQSRMLDGAVTGDDFEDGRLGTIFERLMERASAGAPVPIGTVENNFPGWGVKGLENGAEFVWIDKDYTIEYLALEYAQVVRQDSMRRALGNMVSTVVEKMRDGEGPADIATQASGYLSKVLEGATTGRLATKTLEEILQGSDEYDWLIPHLLERKDRLIVTGPEGSGKTTWVRQMAVLAAAGVNPVTFERMHPLNVLVVDAENTERQWRRAVRWMADTAAREGVIDPSPHINITAGNRIDITRGSNLSEIHRLIDRHKPDLLFIGPLYKLVPKAITNDDDAAPLIVALDSLRERDIALVMEAHAGKAAGADGTRDLRPRGSAALMGWPEFGLGLRPDPDEPNCVDVVRWRGDRDQRQWPKRMYRGADWPWQPIG